MKKNEIYTIKIEGYSSDACGIGHIDGQAVFVPRAMPGEEWEVRIVKTMRDRSYARGERLLHASAQRIEPDCPHYGKCGGCDSRHMSYDEELRFKLSRVNDALRRIGKQSVTAQEIIPSDSVDAYRNKAIYAVAPVDGAACFGFFRERSHSLIPVERCLIQDQLSSRAAKTLVDFMNKRGIPAYDEQSGRGSVRHVFTRRACHTGDAVLCIVSRKGFGPDTGALVAALREACPELSGIVLNINKSEGNTVLSGDFYTLWGSENMQDTLCTLSFNIAPQAFFQINPPQAEKLYQKALEYAALDKDMLAFDLYCGAGTISLCLAGAAGQVIGAEIVEPAVENARQNAADNGIENVEFICSDAAEAVKELRHRGLRPDVVVVDPPRKGLSEDAVRAVAQMQPARIVYVSCDPATLARDVLRFEGHGYALQKATAVDMFPRTRHVETVCLLSKTEP